MSDKYPKVIQVHLTEDQHEALRATAFQRRVGMVECIRGWIGEHCRTMTGAIKTPAASPKHPKASVVGAAPVAKPSMDDLDPGEVLMGKCSKCLDNFPVTALISHPQFPNKKFCPGCVENMKNGQG